jgi:amidase
MAVREPTAGDIRDIAESFGMKLSASDAESFLGLMQGMLASYRRLDGMEEPKPVVKYPREAGHAPRPAENPLNAWAWRTDISGAGEGPLAGRTIALKDTTCLAGVPMHNGSPLLEGFVPDFDATVAERILAAGGRITGKASCENLCFSGGSHTNFLGPVHNPHRRGYATGGSSSGSAALVA